MIKVMLQFKDRILREVQSVDRAITIGRGIENVIRIDNPAVSKYHARILKDQDQYVIEDLDSTNGTYLKEKRINRLVLRDEDEITIGKHTIKIFFQETVGWRPGGHCKETNPDKTMLLETKAHKEIQNS
ncbi:MAG: FHA domain-containing protein [bacterium]